MFVILKPKLQCPVTDLIGTAVDAVTGGDLLGAIFGGGAADAAAGAAAGDVAGDVALGAGLPSIDAATAAGIGEGALGAGVGADVGLTAADVGTAGALASTGATSTLGATATDATGGALAGTGAGAGAAGTGLPEVTVTGAAPGAAGAGTALAPALAATSALAGAQGGGQIGSTTPTQTADVPSGDGGGADTTSGGGSGSFLPATGSGVSGDALGLTPDLASTLGVDADTTNWLASEWAGAAPSADVEAGFTPVSMPSAADIMSSTSDVEGALASSGGGGYLGDVGSWLANPKNAATAGMLGISAFNALRQPALPSAAQTAVGAAGPAVATAETTIQSGGLSSPQWATTKASIDAQINQLEQQTREQMMQTAASSGEGGANSGLVQEQVQSAIAQLEVQRQQLYEQALQQIVNNAVTALTGSNSVLASIGNMQLAQQQQARQAALQTAQLALQLQQLSLPGG